MLDYSATEEDIMDAATFATGAAIVCGIGGVYAILDSGFKRIHRQYEEAVARNHVEFEQRYGFPLERPLPPGATSQQKAKPA